MSFRPDHNNPLHQHQPTEDTRKVPQPVKPTSSLPASLARKTSMPPSSGVVFSGAGPEVGPTASVETNTSLTAIQSQRRGLPAANFWPLDGSRRLQFLVPPRPSAIESNLRPLFESMKNDLRMVRGNSPTDVTRSRGSAPVLHQPAPSDLPQLEYPGDNDSDNNERDVSGPAPTSPALSTHTDEGYQSAAVTPVIPGPAISRDIAETSVQDERLQLQFLRARTPDTHHHSSADQRSATPSPQVPSIYAIPSTPTTSSPNATQSGLSQLYETSIEEHHLKKESSPVPAWLQDPIPVIGKRTSVAVEDTQLKFRKRQKVASGSIPKKRTHTPKSSSSSHHVQPHELKDLPEWQALFLEGTQEEKENEVGQQLRSTQAGKEKESSLGASQQAFDDGRMDVDTVHDELMDVDLGSHSNFSLDEGFVDEDTVVASSATVIVEAPHPIDIDVPHVVASTSALAPTDFAGCATITNPASVTLGSPATRSDNVPVPVLDPHHHHPHDVLPSIAVLPFRNVSSEACSSPPRAQSESQHDELAAFSSSPPPPPSSATGPPPVPLSTLLGWKNRLVAVDKAGRDGKLKESERGDITAILNQMRRVMKRRLPPRNYGTEVTGLVDILKAYTVPTGVTGPDTIKNAKALVKHFQGA